MQSLLLLTPLFLIFEVWQLVMGERYLGIKQIARNGDPRALGLNEITAFLWSAVLFFYGAWMISLLITPFTRAYGASLLAITAIGFSFRRNSSIKWVLVIMTFEGAVRAGLLFSLVMTAWRRS